MEIGLLIRYGRLVPGREERAIELFRETSEYWGEKLSKKEITSFEPFFCKTTDLEEETGFFLIKAPAPDMFRIMEEERYQTLVMKGELVVEHLNVDLLTVGEGITQQLERAVKVRAELGL